jgi:hypothetical protein
MKREEKETRRNTWFRKNKVMMKGFRKRIEKKN